MHDPIAARRLTTLFPVFLGLRLVPPGLWFLSLAIPLAGSRPAPLHAALLVAAALATWWIHRWYRGRFGTVVPGRQGLGRSWALLGGVAVSYLVLAAGAGRLAERDLVLTLTVVLFAAAAGYALPRFLAGPRLALAIALAAALAVGLLLAVPSEPEGLGQMGWLLSMAVGLVLCLAGWVEHRALAAALPAGPEDGDV